MRRLDMIKAREILKLKYEIGLSLREIGSACECGKTTVSEVLERAEKAGVKWPTTLSDKQLMSLLYPPLENKLAISDADMEYVFYEMKKKSVTLMLLWEEYKEKHPDGLMYTQFCEYYKKFRKNNNIFMHIDHKAGEEIQVDWAGQTMTYSDQMTVTKKTAYVFVSVLPASAYPFAYAYSDTKISNWIDAHVRAFEYFGGVPKVIIPDNTKTAVITPDLVDPVMNRSYNEMAGHYGATVVPARAQKPKDKAADENMVGNVSRRIIAALRNRQFFSIYEINEAIRELLIKFSVRPFQKLEGNRITAFERIDKPMLRALPSRRYEYADWKEAKAQFNYHVEYDGFFYSLHYSNVGKHCSVRATSTTIEIFIGTERVAVHARNYNMFSRYTTLPEHMPEEHKAVSGWSNDRFLSWAEKIGPNTKELIKRILESREYAVQSYRACMGIMRYSKEYSSEIMEKASFEAIEKGTCSYKYFSMIVKQESLKNYEKKPEVIVKNSNVRGISAYAGGGVNA